MSNKTAFICIVLSAICTFIIRLMPFMILGGKKEVPKKIKYLGRVLPSTIIAVLIVYCLKDIRTDFISGTEKIIASVVCAVVHLWKKNTLISIVVGTACYMLLSNI